MIAKIATHMLHRSKRSKAITVKPCDTWSEVARSANCRAPPPGTDPPRRCRAAPSAPHGGSPQPKGRVEVLRRLGAPREQVEQPRTGDAGKPAPPFGFCFLGFDGVASGPDPGAPARPFVLSDPLSAAVSCGAMATEVQIP